MQTVTRQQSRPELAAERRAAGAERRAGAAETNAAQDRAEAARLARDLAEMRDDRDRWRAQAERLAAAFERLKVPVPQGESAAVVTLPAQGEDLLYGVPRIAAAFKLTPQQVYHLKDKHGLPTFKTGRIVCAHASAVRRWLAAQADAPQGGH